MAYIALSDRLVFTFTNVRPSATTPPTSFVTELFYLSSTLPVGSVRITVLEAGDGGDMVMGAFMGNENLLDADDVDRLVCLWGGEGVGGGSLWGGGCLVCCILVE